LAQKKNELRVGYQGSEGAYSELAAKKHFMGTAKPLRCIGYHSFRQMLEALKAGELDYAVLPIENSIAGSINESYDLLAKMGLSLVGEEFQPIAHCLIGAADVAVTEIRRVYSHPVALAQCGEFLETLEDCPHRVLYLRLAGCGDGHVDHRCCCFACHWPEATRLRKHLVPGCAARRTSACNWAADGTDTAAGLRSPMERRRRRPALASLLGLALFSQEIVPRCQLTPRVYRRDW